MVEKKNIHKVRNCDFCHRVTYFYSNICVFCRDGIPDYIPKIQYYKYLSNKLRKYFKVNY